MKLSKKNITRLLDADFRKNVLNSMSESKQQSLLIPQYAMLIVNEQILSRSTEYENEKSAYYGFSPIAFFLAVLNDGSMVKRLFELNIANHFLKLKESRKALDVVKCMLILWKKDDDTISCFDLEKIKAELKRIDEEIAKKQLEEAKKQLKSNEENENTQELSLSSSN